MLILDLVVSALFPVPLLKSCFLSRCFNIRLLVCVFGRFVLPSLFQRELATHVGKAAPRGHGLVLKISMASLLQPCLLLRVSVASSARCFKICRNLSFRCCFLLHRLNVVSCFTFLDDVSRSRLVVSASSSLFPPQT